MEGIYDYIKALALKSETVNGPKEGDYKGKDGLWRCGVCHALKQTSLDCGGETLHPFVPCDCKKRAEKMVEDQNIANMAADDLQKRREDCFPATAKGCPMLSMTFEKSNGTNEKPMSIAKRYCNAFDLMLDKGEGLLLWGLRGTGKTYIAGCIANSLLDSGKKVKFVQMPTIIRAAQVGEFVPEDYNKYHLIIIDDLGVERQTDFAQEVLWSMIEERVKNQLPMVITTNISLDEIKRRSGLTESAEKKCSCFDRALSKILEACTPIEINETNERRNKIWEKQQFVKETLGI